MRPLALAALVAFAPACSSDRSFPGDFVFGTAVAGFQVDMGCPTIPAERCEDRASDWYGYITSTAAPLCRRQSDNLSRRHRAWPPAIGLAMM